MKIIGGVEIPEGWESVSCPNECGFFVAWEIPTQGVGVREMMATHFLFCNYEKGEIQNE